MFRVTIEEIEDGEAISATMRSADSLGTAIGCALHYERPGRPDKVIAEIIECVGLDPTDVHDVEFFSGHNSAIAKMNEAAELILVGWGCHDKKTQTTHHARSGS